MLPKKLFTPKCLHVDRDIVFMEDLKNFYFYVYKNIIDEDKLKKFDYKTYKKFYNDKKISMLHFSKSKEENYKEYYEVLFGEVQMFMIDKYVNCDDNLICKIFSVFTLYSLYYTQTSDYFYQINTIPEILIEINKLIECLETNQYFKLKNEIILMTDKLYKSDAFSIGSLIGLKTIILNKYGLPLELKMNTYNDYIDINNTAKIIDNYDNKSLNISMKENYNEYSKVKKTLIDNIKNLGNDFQTFKTDLYCDYINKMSQVPLYEGMNLIIEDILNKKITNLDIQLNQVDNYFK